MQTNNLKDLSCLKSQIASKVASVKPGQDKSICVWPSPECMSERIIEKIACNYHKKLEQRREFVNQSLYCLYNRPLSFPDSSVSEMYRKVRELTEFANKSIEEIAIEFRTFLGYRCSFYRRSEGKSVPITSEVLKAAYQAIKKGSSKSMVENILYKTPTYDNNKQ